MKLFVTGGAGFIGSNFVRVRLAKGDFVTVFDALTYAGNESTLQQFARHDNYRFIHADIREPTAIADAVRGHDAIVHFAAESHVDRSISGPHEFVSTNCIGTALVMQAALDAHIARVIHVSTDETYGSIESGSFTESDKLTPRSPYSASKAGSDLIAISYFTTYNLPVIVTRASNNFGPYQHPEKLIPRFVTNLIEDRKVPLMGDGGNVRDWIYVEDHCAGIESVLENGQVGEIYNIGGGNEITNAEITKQLLALMGKDESYITPIPDRLGHDRRYSVSSEKVKTLGWQPQHTFASALAETVNWYRANPWWWEPLKRRDDSDGGV